MGTDGHWVNERDRFDERMAKWYPGRNIVKTSDYNPLYNCVAWAAGDVERTWSDFGRSHWPGKRGNRIEHLASVFEGLGYQDCGLDESLEDGFEKVALFALGDLWQHVCKQCPDGRWSSKLGIQEDVQHDLHDIEDDDYGQVVLIMKRPALQI